VLPHGTDALEKGAHNSPTADSASAAPPRTVIAPMLRPTNREIGEIWKTAAKTARNQPLIATVAHNVATNTV
jgi:hypothetical protein